MSHIKRLQRDIFQLQKNPLDDEGIFFWWDEEDLTKIFVLVIGPKETPYAGGYFLIRLDFNTNYPFDSPKGHFMTQDYRKRTRLHPNLYHDGKICLSIFGTWEGPKWQPTLNLRTIALSLIGLLSANPIVHEPSYESTKPNSKIGRTYTQIVEYETIQVTILDQLDRLYQNAASDVLLHFSGIMKENFLKNYNYFISQINKLKEQKLNNTSLYSPCYDVKTTFNLDKLETDLHNMKEKIESEMYFTASENEDENDS